MIANIMSVYRYQFIQTIFVLLRAYVCYIQGSIIITSYMNSELPERKHGSELRVLLPILQSTLDIDTRETCS